MAASPYVPTYHNTTVTPTGVGTFDINWIEAGSRDHSTILLLHGFPSSSIQYRDFIPLLSNDYHVLAPDLPGFGLTKSPAHLNFTFDNLTAAISAWLIALNITSFVPYMFDYGAAVAQRLALANPDQVKAIVTQNGNAYEAGFGYPFWDPIMSFANMINLVSILDLVLDDADHTTRCFQALWTNNNSTNREYLRDNYLTLSTTQYQYTAGVPKSDHDLIDPVQWTTDYLMNEAGKQNQDHQLSLFYDYRTNVALYPKVHEYFRKSQVPLLAAWGKGDPAFIPPGAYAYKQDLPNAEVHLLDAGHFALETKRWEIARLMIDFLRRNGIK